MSEEEVYDYIVVGSGAGGGTLAARLAEGGMRVALLEAGGDPRGPGKRLPDDYDVPAFHPFASENPALRWDFFVRHYKDLAQRRRDPKFTAEEDGVLYPRAGTLGGCTAHNAMILMRPPPEDWDAIAALTGDASWKAAAMQHWFRRLESCRHRPLLRLLARLGVDPSRHGWDGWLPSERAAPLAVLRDLKLVHALAGSALLAFAQGGRLWRHLRWLLRGRADPNDWRPLRVRADGLIYTPLTTDRHHRIGARERVLAVAARHPDRLHVLLHALVIRVLLDSQQRAVGVECQMGERLYRADPNPAVAPGERRCLRARREVILAGGAFNTPQLLMLSGIGEAAELARHGIACRVDLPGVGRNLQDRYEVGVVNRMGFPAWRVLRGARFRRGDRQWQRWERGQGMYVSNGAAIALTRRSTAARRGPDLFFMALLGEFRGYFPGYSRLIAERQNCLTWAILKAHTANRAGRVRLASADPRDRPLVDFHYFEDGDDPGGSDLAAVVEAIRSVRRMTAPMLREGLMTAEELPGPDVQSDAELAGFVRDHAWGHHASCSCAIGPRVQGGVLDSAFRVHGTSGLRVVDASVFPRIPGFFIACAVYMVAEKAAALLLREAAP
jgi:choline dehydrogenase-like flavoprotein